MKTIIKIILIALLILAGPTYLFLSPMLKKAPQSVQLMQRELKKVPQTLDMVKRSEPIASNTSSIVDSIIKNTKEIITIASSGIGVALGARELKKEKRKRRATAKK